MISFDNFLTFALMAGATWLSRVTGYLLLRNRNLSERAQAVMQATPGCVLVTVVAPYFSSTKPTDLIPLLITLAFSTKCSFFVTICAGIFSAFVMRNLL